RYTYTVTLQEVVKMTNIVLLLAALLFAFGVLIGSGLHTRAVDRQYRRIAQRVRELHELQADQHEVRVLTRSRSQSPWSYPE
ncbi:MAG: hypothetical protein WCC65_16665, partial [Pseudonocardiaceae bacterium]